MLDGISSPFCEKASRHFSPSFPQTINNVEHGDTNCGDSAHPDTENGVQRTPSPSPLDPGRVKSSFGRLAVTAILSQQGRLVNGFRPLRICVRRFLGSHRSLDSPLPDVHIDTSTARFDLQTQTCFEQHARDHVNADKFDDNKPARPKVVMQDPGRVLVGRGGRRQLAHTFLQLACGTGSCCKGLVPLVTSSNLPCTHATEQVQNHRLASGGRTLGGRSGAGHSRPPACPRLADPFNSHSDWW